MIQFRKTISQDLDGLKEVLDSSELFPSEYLEDMIADFLNNPETEEIWFTALLNDQVIGFGYCIAEKFTEGTYNLLAIAVRKEIQGKGTGRKMMDYVEQLLKDKAARVLIVETSSDPNFKQTSDFYRKLSYQNEAVIRDFWKEGEDKLIFWKKLN